MDPELHADYYSQKGYTLKSNCKKDINHKKCVTISKDTVSSKNENIQELIFFVAKFLQALFYD